MVGDVKVVTTWFLSEFKDTLVVELLDWKCGQLISIIEESSLNVKNVESLELMSYPREERGWETY